MTFKKFIQLHTGKTVDFDGALPGQCVDLYRVYVRDVLGFPQSPAISGARLIWNTYLPQYYDRIPNTLLAIPKEGDIIIWNAMPGNPYGHVGICVSGGFWSFTSFDSNWSTPKRAKLEKHNYRHVIGWLRPRNKKELIDRVGEALILRGDNPSRSVGTLTVEKWWQNRVERGEIKDFADLVDKITWHQVNKRYPHDN